ncbi:hypothetical protein [Prochlorothrix hollandica]|uniref:GIY-YIG domain-containing protein n=1 Tax=Prochlorothrix hollandica PCC 9006 = CALU 1027 TaxID=317619 RepID=A0A0M2Q3V1_PROHO|nr:hypothetical protein [Prochlorothrix hollandica]KKJ01272.1 hypothetical protein PROH_02590 [Prochlorothrix hollandica PCC 9006 = CALU 1027]
MAWSSWIEFRFKSSGELNLDRVENVRPTAGVYAIATKTGSRYNVQYVGRSGRSMRGRVQAHLKGKGNKVLASLLAHKKQMPTDPTPALYVAYWETAEHKLVEAVHISASDRPICNLIKGSRLPDGLREGDVLKSPLED